MSYRQVVASPCICAQCVTCIMKSFGGIGAGGIVVVGHHDELRTYIWPLAFKFMLVGEYSCSCVIFLSANCYSISVRWKRKPLYCSLMTVEISLRRYDDSGTRMSYHCTRNNRRNPQSEAAVLLFKAAPSHKFLQEGTRRSLQMLHPPWIPWSLDAMHKVSPIGMHAAVTVTTDDSAARMEKEDCVCSTLLKPMELHQLLPALHTGWDQWNQQACTAVYLCSSQSYGAKHFHRISTIWQLFLCAHMHVSVPRTGNTHHETVVFKSELEFIQVFYIVSS